MTDEPPTATDLLNVWDRAAGQSGALRAFSLFRAACPGRSEEELGRERVGGRDLSLLRLRERLFGSRLECIASCPECREALEFSLVSADLFVDRAANADDGELKVSTGGCVVRFRPPEAADLIAVEASCGDPDEAAGALLGRCILEAVRDGRPVPASSLPPSMVDLLDGQMQAADPQADVLVSLSCPACGCGWEESFDIATYLWDEIDTWARHVVRDVHALASGYGWREADILAMSAQRRRAYLDLVEA